MSNVFCGVNFWSIHMTHISVCQVKCWVLNELQRDYEEYKVRVNALVAKAQKTPDEGWTMQDGTPWPGNNPRDHPGMIQVNSAVY